MTESESKHLSVRQKRQSLIGAGLFLLGLFLAVILSVIVFWPDQEAIVFDQTLVNMPPMRSLRCPLVITPKDNAEINVTITNTHIRPTTLRIRARIAESSTLLFREDIQQIALEPDEKSTLSWPIFMEDAVFDTIIMARVNQFQRTPFPARSSSCGVLTLNVSWITGNQIVALLILGAILSLAAGSFLWLRTAWPLIGRRREAAMRGLIMLIFVGVSILAGLLQLTAFALILLIFSAIFLISLLERLY